MSDPKGLLALLRVRRDLLGSDAVGASAQTLRRNLDDKIAALEEVVVEQLPLLSTDETEAGGSFTAVLGDDHPASSGGTQS